MTAIAPIYFVIFVLMAQFVLVNVVVAVLMKKLDVNLLLSGGEDLEQRRVLSLGIQSDDGR